MSPVYCSNVRQKSNRGNEVFPMHGKDRSVNFLSYKVGILQNCLSDGALFPMSCRRHGNAFHIIVYNRWTRNDCPQLSTPGNNVCVLQELCTIYNCEKVELHRSGIMESNSLGAHWIFNHQPHFYTRLFISMYFYRHACFKANYKLHFCTSQIVLSFLHRTLVLFFYIDVILTLYIEINKFCFVWTFKLIISFVLLFASFWCIYVRHFI